jgi:hypothetical protein
LGRRSLRRDLGGRGLFRAVVSRIWVWPGHCPGGEGRLEAVDGRAWLAEDGCNELDLPPYPTIAYSCRDGELVRWSAWVVAGPAPAEYDPAVCQASSAAPPPPAPTPVPEPALEWLLVLGVVLLYAAPHMWFSQERPSRNESGSSP